MGIDLLIAAGGTGGHIYPALAVAEEAVSRGKSICFAGTKDRMESRLIPEAGYEMETIKAYPVRGRGVVGSIGSMATVSLSVAGAMKMLRRVKPQAVLGAGGFVSAPVLAAACLMRIPAALLEQNSEPGLANRYLGKVVRRAFVTYSETVDCFSEGRAVVTGNPLRRSIVEAANRQKIRKGKKVRLLILGGSQGALSINKTVPLALDAAKLGDKVDVIHQAGKDKTEEAKAGYEQVGIQADVVEYIDDVGSAYSNTDMILCRSGATTLAEIAVTGVPAVFIPFPYHSDNQQKKNAKIFVQAGAAIICEEPLDPSVLGEVIGEIVADPKKREDMSRAMLSLARPDAAARIVDLLEEII